MESCLPPNFSSSAASCSTAEVDRCREQELDQYQGDRDDFVLEKNLRRAWRCHGAWCGPGHVGRVDTRYAERWPDHAQCDKGRHVYSGQTTRVGPNGATYTSNSTCRDDLSNRCRRSYSATDPNGRTYSGNTVTARGPHRMRSIGVHTGPRGNVGIGFRRHWR
jgi:hypothetical protein